MFYLPKYLKGETIVSCTDFLLHLGLSSSKMSPALTRKCKVILYLTNSIEPLYSLTIHLSQSKDHIFHMNVWDKSYNVMHRTAYSLGLPERYLQIV